MAVKNTIVIINLIERRKKRSVNHPKHGRELQRNGKYTGDQLKRFMNKMPEETKRMKRKK